VVRFLNRKAAENDAKKTRRHVHFEVFYWCEAAIRLPMEAGGLVAATGGHQVFCGLKGGRRALMLKNKKLLVAAAAAAVVSVPLAGLAGADPGDPQNGGGQGNGSGTIGPPGTTVSTISTDFVGGHTGEVFKVITGGTPGQYQQQFKP
jgi:hypothetical protein